MVDDRRRRAVVVTGASTGIGEACALRLAAHGFRVFGAVRNPADGEVLKSKAGESLVPVLLDVTDGDGIARAAAEVAAAVGDNGLAGLVNNAGIAVNGPPEFLPIDLLRKQLEVNLIGQVAVTQAFLPLLRKATGRIVNIGSLAGLVSAPFSGPYSMSKYGMEAFTDALRVELMRWGLHVALVEPGSVATPIWNRSIADVDWMEKRLSEHAMTLYGENMATFKEGVRRTALRGIPADAVAEAVEHALTATRPRTRYLIGRDAQFLAGFFRRLPDRWRDRLIRKFALRDRSGE